jgi:hypothetical protein
MGVGIPSSPKTASMAAGGRPSARVTGFPTRTPGRVVGSVIALLTLGLALTTVGCRPKSAASDTSAITYRSGGVYDPNGYVVFSAPNDVAVCTGVVVNNNVVSIAGYAETASFQSTLATLMQQSKPGLTGAPELAKAFHQKYISSTVGFIDNASLKNPDDQLAASLAMAAVHAAAAPANPSACNQMSVAATPPTGGGTPSGTPPYLFVLMSYGSSLFPAKTHTFGFFAKIDPQQPGKIIEHIPISWLPIVTTPANDPNGMPVLDASGVPQVGEIAVNLRIPRLGWSFSMTRTERLAANLGFDAISGHGAFVVTEKQYLAAKAFYESLDANVRRVASQTSRNPERYYYQASNGQMLHGCPDGVIPGELNCFQAVLAAFGTCDKTLLFSGDKVTQMILKHLQRNGFLGRPYYSDAEQLAV